MSTPAAAALLVLVLVLLFAWIDRWDRRSGG